MCSSLPMIQAPQSPDSKCTITPTLVYIPFMQIEDALERARLSFKKQQDFNTHFHSIDEISTVLPDFHHHLPQTQPWILLEPYLPIIAASQGYNEDRIHQIQLPRSLVTQLPRITQSSEILGHISESDREDLDTIFPRHTTRGLEIDPIVKDQQYFIRLDATSLKDALTGSGPAQDVDDLWTRLATSRRGMRGAIDLQACYPSTCINMWLLPWQDIEPSMEYRVFCPPARAGRTRIAAVSQYQWHERWRHAGLRRAQAAIITEKLLDGCEHLLQEILQSAGMTAAVRDRGFVFDVAEKRNGEGWRLIELNDFGAMTGCGSCLFHWVRDAEVLYGLGDAVEVRVTV